MNHQRDIILTFRLNQNEKQTLNRYAADANMTESAVIRNAVHNFIDRNPIQPKRDWTVRR